MLANNAVPFGILYLIINAPSSIYAFTLAGTPGADEDTGVKLLSFAEAFLGLAAGAAATYGTVQELRGRRSASPSLAAVDWRKAGPRSALHSCPEFFSSSPSSPSSSRVSSSIRCGGSPFPWPSSSGRAPWPACGAAPSSLAAIAGGCSGSSFACLPCYSQPFLDRVTAVATWLLSALFMAVQAVLTAVSYYYLRVAREGIGIEDIGAVFD